MKKYVRQFKEATIENAKLEWCNARNASTIEKKKGLNLNFNEIVNFQSNIRDIFDNRKKVDKIVVSYLDDKRDEYRISFIYPPLTGESNALKLIPRKI